MVFLVDDILIGGALLVGAGVAAHNSKQKKRQQALHEAEQEYLAAQQRLVEQQKAEEWHRQQMAAYHARMQQQQQQYPQSQPHPSQQLHGNHGPLSPISPSPQGYPHRPHSAKPYAGSAFVFDTPQPGHLTHQGTGSSASIYEPTPSNGPLYNAQNPSRPATPPPLYSSLYPSGPSAGMPPAAQPSHRARQDWLR